jgi:ADP-heptose:LPS heptosyltransferase
MRILILQTTRMGDMLQTSPLIRMVRSLHPDAHITAMVRGMGKVIGQRHPDIDDIMVYNEDDMFLDMRSRDSNRLLHAYEMADKVVQDMRARKFDLCYNVTHSIASAMLMRLAQIPTVVGADIGKDAEFVLRGDWANYFFTSVFNRDYNDLNLCDITRSFATNAPPCRELIFELRDEDRAFVDALWLEHGIQRGDFVACMQLGASEMGKRWSVERFAQLAQLLRAQRNAHVFLLGVDEEAPLGATFEAAAPGLAIPLFGKTSVPQVSAVLERSNVLITNDTGTMHLAAAARCPIVLVSVGHVHYRETGPFGEGHAAIEWRKESLGRSDMLIKEEEERTRICAEQVLRVVDHVTGSAPAIEDDGLLDEVDVYQTRFAPDGCLQFYPALKRPMAERDLIRIAYRAMWLGQLPGSPPPEAMTEAARQMLACYDGPHADTVAGWAKVLSAQFMELADVGERGVRGTTNLLHTLNGGGPMARARQEVALLTRLDEEVRIHSQLYAACRPLAMMARFERDNLEGADPKVLAETTLRIYEALRRRATGVARALDHIVNLWPESH